METNDKTKLILDECKKLEDVINNNLLIEFGKLHNIKPEFNKLSVKQEIISDRGYFTGVKNKYVLHIISKKGIPCDEYEIKGIVTKRSDYPQKTKELLPNLFDILLKDKTISIKKLNDFIEQNRTIITNEVLKFSKSIARPITFKKDEADYKKDNQPHHIKAMLLWNKLEYDYFKQGDKGYLFKINGIDLKHNKSYDIDFTKNVYIAIPQEEEFLPEYYIVDVKYMVDFAWDKRIEEFLKPILDKIKNVKKVSDYF